MDTFDLDRAMEGPWVQHRIGLERFQEYIDALGDHLPTVCAQHRLRAERALDKALRDIAEDNARSYARWRGQEIDDAVDALIPPVVWSSAFLTVWSAFERALARIVEYLETKEPAVAGQPDRARRSYKERIRYLSKIAPIGQTWSESDHTRLTELYKIRNAFVHANGILDQGNAKQAQAMIGIIGRWECSVSEDGEIEPNEKLVRRALQFLTARLNDIETKCRTRYGIG